jgi:hypothetical protein
VRSADNVRLWRRRPQPVLAAPMAAAWRRHPYLLCAHRGRPLAALLGVGAGGMQHQRAQMHALTAG